MRMKDHLCPEGKCRIDKGLELDRVKEEQLAAHLESVDQSKWTIWRDFKFAYEVDIEPHDLDIHLTKLAHTLKQEQAK